MRVVAGLGERGIGKQSRIVGCGLTQPGIGFPCAADRLAGGENVHAYAASDRRNMELVLWVRSVPGSRCLGTPPINSV